VTADPFWLGPGDTRVHEGQVLQVDAGLGAASVPSRAHDPRGHEMAQGVVLRKDRDMLSAGWRHG
jgi:hypothetical protein